MLLEEIISRIDNGLDEPQLFTELTIDLIDATSEQLINFLPKLQRCSNLEKIEFKNFNFQCAGLGCSIFEGLNKLVEVTFRNFLQEDEEKFKLPKNMVTLENLKLLSLINVSLDQYSVMEQGDYIRQKNSINLPELAPNSEEMVENLKQHINQGEFVIYIDSAFQIEDLPDDLKSYFLTKIIEKEIVSNFQQSDVSAMDVLNFRLRGLHLLAINLPSMDLPSMPFPPITLSYSSNLLERQRLVVGNNLRPMEHHYQLYGELLERYFRRRERERAGWNPLIFSRIEEEMEQDDFDDDRDSENTMDQAIFVAAQKSERLLREVCEFPRETADQKEEEALIQELIEEIKILGESKLIGYTLSGLPFYDDIPVALRSLNPRYGKQHSNNDTLSFTDIKGYGMKNVVALYFKAIKAELFCEGVDKKIALESLCAGIAGGTRGENRNNNDGIDNQVIEDSPVCGKGHYNKIAECMVSVIKGVELVFDLQGAITKSVTKFIENRLSEFCKLDKEKILKLQNIWNGEDLNESDKDYRKFVDQLEERENFDIAIQEFLESEFVEEDNQSFIEEITASINSQIRAMGGIVQYLGSYTICCNINPNLEVEPESVSSISCKRLRG